MEHYLDELVKTGDRILLLQGPIGSFFTDLSKWLSSNEKVVFKLNFNAGDEYFYPKETAYTFAYRESLEAFNSYLTNFCQKHRIDNIICFGDNRHYHRIAKQVCERLNLTFWAFEEGYFRPEYITLEKWGVNAFSPISREADFFLEYANLPEPPAPQKVAKGFKSMAKHAILYYYNAYFKRKNYPNYRHHRILNIDYYLKLWSVSGVKRLCYWLHDGGFAKRVERGEFGEFFIIPLQVYDDSQVQVHCDQKSVEVFLRQVLDSFVAHAPHHLNLIIKHHPMDRGFIDYGLVIDEYIAKYPRLKGKISYIHDVPMPVFLRHAKGMVTLNSTSGISGLVHKMPVKTLGRANYDFAGLTDQQSLDEFWTNPTPPNEEVFNGYRKFHLYKTHLNGSFYSQVILHNPYHRFPKS